MNAHSHGDLEHFLCLARRRDRSRRGWEGDEEGVALRVDLDAAVLPERLPQDLSMVRECLGIAL